MKTVIQLSSILWIYFSLSRDSTSMWYIFIPTTICTFTLMIVSVLLLTFWLRWTRQCQQFFLCSFFCTYYTLTDSNGDYDTYWYGSYSNGYGLYTPGSVMTLYFDGLYNYPGFQLVYYPADPGNSIFTTRCKNMMYEERIRWNGWNHQPPFE